MHRSSAAGASPTSRMPLPPLSPPIERLWRQVDAALAGSLRFRGRTAGIQAVWLALGWNIAVWLGFIAGTEFFVAYKSEGPFRELLVIALLMPVIIAVVPDRIAADDADREVPSGACGKMPGKATTIAPSRLVSSLPEPGGSRST